MKSLLPCALITGWMFRIAKSQNLGEMTRISDPNNVFVLPSEDVKHEATWLQWPHNYGWDPRHIQRYEDIWVEMTRALHTGEKVRIIVYNWRQKRRVRNVLENNGLDMSQIQFYTYPTDDVWIRDNGPIFVQDQQGNMIVENWKFNGWGGKADWWYDDYIPRDVSWELYLPVTSIPMVNEGGSIEVDGRGTLMAKRSSILNDNRNPGATQAEVEAYFRRYLGVTNFIWLDGTAGLEITDDHIDGTARFANGDTIVTLEKQDFIVPTEYDILTRATDADGKPYKIVHLPLTAKEIPSIGEHGLYINYYAGNNAIVFPIFQDANDQKAIDIIQGLYPDKTVVPIDFTELYLDGGLAHCVTMQQPTL
ncbi:unnamed protein product [Cylindrotheca closterium]|uniref:Agmatine deiminase n=1 Tax=Cylindrotheca closterium TaxID=2856 RepID=A0AAD2CCP7_9STRA|nr:unnamed protein product [Cylindrotheca closterium]